MSDDRIIKETILKKGKKGNGYILECNYCHKDFFSPGISFRRGYGKYCCVSCANKGERRGFNYNTKRYDKGYVLIRTEDPRRNKLGFFPEHILVAEKKYNRMVAKGEHVHHINSIRNDNRPENLIILTASEHQKLHHKKEGINVPCENCGKEVYNWNYLMNKFKHRYCSRKCYIEHRFKKHYGK